MQATAGLAYVTPDPGSDTSPLDVLSPLQNNWHWRSLPVEQQRTLFKWTPWSEMQARRDSLKEIGDDTIAEVNSKSARECCFDLPARLWCVCFGAVP